MTMKKKAEWWLYIILGVMLLGFLAPTLVSAADTFAVLMAVLILVLYGVWSWYLWIDKFIIQIKKEAGK